jgi:branched-chain amino acid transport system ATP-binding protein
VAVLESHDLVKEFAGFRAVNGVSLTLEEGKIHALVGPNGAGKTTLFNLFTGFLRPTAGRIVLFGEDATDLRPDQIAKRGVARSFQVTSLFEQLTALEHVLLALESRTGLAGVWWRSADALRRSEPRARDLLAEVGLSAFADRPAASLPYGQKRALEIALALALDPRLLLLDEPTAGMGLEDVRRTIDLVQRVRAGRTVLLVEHNMGVVGELSDRVVVMQQGRIIADGVYDDVRHRPEVVTAYLGQVDA